MNHRDEIAGNEVLICVGKYAGYIGIYTNQKPMIDSRNCMILVDKQVIEYSNTALRIYPNCRREDGIIRPEDIS